MCPPRRENKELDKGKKPLLETKPNKLKWFKE